MKQLIKRLEGWNKQCWYALFRLLFRVQPVALPLESGRLKKVLVFRYDRVGDMVVTQPALRYLHSRGMEVHVLCSSANSSVLDDDKGIVARRLVLGRRVISFLRSLRELRAQDYDAIFCMVFHRTTNAGVLANVISRRALKIGRLYEKRQALYSTLFSVQVHVQSPRNTMPELLLHLCSAIEGKQFEATDFDYRLDIADSRRAWARDFVAQKKLQKCVLINISASTELRSFGLDQTLTMIKVLQQQLPGRSIALLCMPRERELALKIAAHNSDIVQVLPPIPHILDVAALIEQCSIVISPDTATIHLSDCMKVPLIGVYLDPSHYWFASSCEQEIVVCADANKMSSMREQDFQQALTRLLSRIQP